MSKHDKKCEALLWCDNPRGMCWCHERELATDNELLRTDCDSMRRDLAILRDHHHEVCMAEIERLRSLLVRIHGITTDPEIIVHTGDKENEVARMIRDHVKVIASKRSTCPYCGVVQGEAHQSTCVAAASAPAVPEVLTEQWAAEQLGIPTHTIPVEYFSYYQSQRIAAFLAGARAGTAVQASVKPDAGCLSFTSIPMGPTDPKEGAP